MDQVDDAGLHHRLGEPRRDTVREPPKASRTPRLRSSVSTLSQNFADSRSLLPPAQIPRMSL